MFIFIAIVIPIAIIAVVFLFFTNTKPKKILGIYSQPNNLYLFKIAVFYCIVSIRRLRSRGKTDCAGYGMKSRSDVKHMECPQPLSNHPKAIDAVYFNAADSNGNYLVTATARRPNGVINGFLYIRIPSIGTLVLPKMPDTLMFGDGNNFSAEGLTLTPLIPMKSWKVEYKGKMIQSSNNLKSYDVELDALWISNLPYFDFDIDMHIGAVSRSMAKEEWSRKYFQDLKEAHQTHYEQMGKLNGKVKINEEIYELRLDSMRDHSYGHKREWKLMHRYALHMIHTENGLQITVGVVCQPVTCSQLELGYVNLANGEIVAISSVNLPLWQHGEGGRPPKDYAFTFIAGGVEYRVETHILESHSFYIGWEWETKVVEQFATYKVNGTRAWGIAEWDYRNYRGRPHPYSEKDPSWTKDINKG